MAEPRVLVVAGVGSALKLGLLKEESNMKLWNRALLTAALMCLVLAPMRVGATTVSDAGVSRDVAVRDVSSGPDGVTGVLVNRTDTTVRNVQLLVRHSWVWNNERHPGEDSPGESYYTTVPNDIPPGGSVRFTYRPPGGVDSNETGGHFATDVQVTGFTQVTYPAAAQSGEPTMTIQKEEYYRGAPPPSSSRRGEPY